MTRFLGISRQLPKFLFGLSQTIKPKCWRREEQLPSAALGSTTPSLPSSGAGRFSVRDA